jgi:transcriptional regulator with PAS, ATPase and Fis domain
MVKIAVVSEVITRIVATSAQIGVHVSVVEGVQMESSLESTTRLKSMEKRIVLSKKANAQRLLAKIPEGLTSDDIKYLYIDVVVERYQGNLTRSAKALGVSYKTMTNWVHGNYPTTCKSRGRGKPKADEYK